MCGLIWNPYESMRLFTSYQSAFNVSLAITCKTISFIGCKCPRCNGPERLRLNQVENSNLGGAGAVRFLSPDLYCLHHGFALRQDQTWVMPRVWYLMRPFRMPFFKVRPISMLKNCDQRITRISKDNTTKLEGIFNGDSDRMSQYKDFSSILSIGSTSSRRHM